MERVSDFALLANLSPNQVRQVRDHVMDRISEANRRWQELGTLTDPECDDEILEIFKELDKLEESLEAVEKFIAHYASRPAAGRAA